MKKQYVMPTSNMQEICLRSCIMSGGNPKDTKVDEKNITPMPGVAARRLYV